MIAVSERRFLPTLPNTIVIYHEGYYYYVHRAVYDMAVILSDRHTLVSLVSNVIPISNEETILWFYENAPSPINILAPYIGLVEGDIPKDIIACCGVLHAISAVINLRGFINHPKEIRKSVKFSLSIREEYEMAWDSFFANSIPYEERGSVMSKRDNYSNEHSDVTPQGNEWKDLGGGMRFNIITHETEFMEDEESTEADEDFLSNLFVEPEEAEEKKEEDLSGLDDKSRSARLLEF